MAKRTPMRPDGIGPDPHALAAGNFAPDREGEVLRVILSGASDGTNEGILAHLLANPPASWRGRIREPTIRYFTKSATEAGIIEARRMAGKTVYVPLEDGPPFARATPEGLAFRRLVIENSTPVDLGRRIPTQGGAVGQGRAKARDLMLRLESLGLGTVTSTERRDRFALRPDLPAARLLTERPESRSFIRSEDGGLLFRAPSAALREGLIAVLPNDTPGNAPSGLEYRWSDLDSDVLDRLFEAVIALGGSAGPRAEGPEPAVLVERLDCGDLSNVSRSWTINDANERHFHGIVRLAESPLMIRLSWQPGPDSVVTEIGCLLLDLNRLLSDGYVQPEREGSDSSELRLRFVRGEDGVISIQIRSNTPALPVTWVEPMVLRAAGL